MEEFAYYRPSSLQEAVNLIEQLKDYAILAGGTDLLVQMKLNIKKPKAVISLRDIQELKVLKESSKQITIGSLVTHETISNSELILKYAPLLADAAGMVGSPQIRNKGTIGGNIANASPAADTIPALVALGAKVEIESKQETRNLFLEELFIGPGKTNIRAGEILKTITFPKLKENQSGAFVKLGKRKALAISVINAAVVVEVDKDKRKFTNSKIVFGSVAPTVLRIKEAEDMLKDKEITEEVIDAAANIVGRKVTPITDIRSTAEYRKASSEKVARNAIIEALKQLGINL